MIKILRKIGIGFIGLSVLAGGVKILGLIAGAVEESGIFFSFKGMVIGGAAVGLGILIISLIMERIKDSREEKEDKNKY